MHNDLFQLIESNTLVLTVNQRLSITIQRQYHQWKKKKNHQWVTPLIIPLSQWADDTLLQYAHAEAPALSSWQEKHLWQDIIKQDTKETLLQPHLTAELAQNTWQLLAHWLLPWDLLQDSVSHEVQAFLRWAQQFQEQCQALNVRSQASTLPLLADLMKRQALPLPHQIIFIGFDEFTPVQKALINALKSHVQVSEYQYDITPKTATKIQLADTDTEIRSMARWAKSILARSPASTIGCIVPELTSLRAPVTRLFNEVFDPSLFMPADQRASTSFNLSASAPLHSYAIIHDALAITQLALGQFDIDIIPTILTSPYLCHHVTDDFAGTAVDDVLRQQQMPTPTWEALINAVHAVHPQYPDSTWATRFKSLQALRINQPSEAAPSAWASWVLQWLVTAGWPGQRAINSLEYQLIERFKLALTQWHELDAIHPLWSFTQVIPMLKQQLKDIAFQPEGSDAPIQILGALESSGCTFDYLWIMGLDDEHWPAPVSTNPFLPADFQREHLMPHSSADKELTFAMQVTQRWKNSAHHLVCSAPLSSGDKTLHFSELIAALDTGHIDNCSLADDSMALRCASNPALLESVIDDQAPPLSHQETIRGGSSILKHQSACPFKAFATLRLLARPISTVEIGLTPQQAGTLLHKSLELFWEKTKDSSALNAYSEKELEAEVGYAIRQAITTEHTFSHDTFLMIEKKRLARLLKEWLLIEKQRPAFTVIAKEQHQQYTFGELTLNVQLDRIDELSDGSHLVIDYKTGLARLSSWFSSRPDEPQCPLYCLPNDKMLTIQGVSFAQVKAGDMQFKGLSHESSIDTQQAIQGISSVTDYRYIDTPATNWNDTLLYWKETLQDISQSFIQGHAVVDPKSPSHCQYCELSSLCRIQES